MGKGLKREREISKRKRDRQEIERERVNLFKDKKALRKKLSEC